MELRKAVCKGGAGDPQAGCPHSRVPCKAHSSRHWVWPRALHPHSDLGHAWHVPHGTSRVQLGTKGLKTKSCLQSPNSRARGPTGPDGGRNGGFHPGAGRDLASVPVSLTPMRGSWPWGGREGGSLPASSPPPHPPKLGYVPQAEEGQSRLLRPARRPEIQFGYRRSLLVAVQVTVAPSTGPAVPPPPGPAL